MVQKRQLHIKSCCRSLHDRYFTDKKDKEQAAVSDFDEFTVLEPGEYLEYIGFTENEVRVLCDKYNMSFEKAKE